MITGILGGVAWALETVILGIALRMAPFVSSEQALLLAPFIATFLHDALSAVYLLLYNALRGNLGALGAMCRQKSTLWIVLSSAIGGPVGMTGYVLAVRYLGASVGAVASAVYPAIGTVLACLFLGEKRKWYQWCLLAATLLGVYGLSYSPDLNASNVGLGLLGALLCAFGWGIEAVILAKCLKDDTLNKECVLAVRQVVSASVFGTVLLPLLGGWGMTVSLFTEDTGWLLPTLGAAALCATVSYLLYYAAIRRVGASRAMALNVTYTAWAIVLGALLLGDFSALNPVTLLLAAVIVVCGILSATDWGELFGKKQPPKKEENE